MTQPPPRASRATLDPVALHILRSRDGHSLTSLSKISALSVSYLCDLEKGRRKGNPGVIKALAEALNVPQSMLTARPEQAA